MARITKHKMTIKADQELHLLSTGFFKSVVNNKRAITLTFESSSEDPGFLTIELDREEAVRVLATIQAHVDKM